MPNYEQKEPVAADASSALSATVTVVAGHGGADAMGTRSMTVGRFEEIRRRLTDGRGVREIARALSCSAIRCAKCEMGCATHPMRRKLARIHCGCCNWIGWPSFTIWGWAIH